MGICYEGLPRGYSNGTIDGLNLVIIQVLYSGQRAGNLGPREVNGWKFDKNFLIINNVHANNKNF